MPSLRRAFSILFGWRALGQSEKKEIVVYFSKRLSREILFIIEPAIRSSPSISQPESFNFQSLTDAQRRRRCGFTLCDHMSFGHLSAIFLERENLKTNFEHWL
ncbi:NADH-ubiquinone oxidoreductase [Trifolium repens]|nr:NADH-ubiquinone oxidoreductase [Trifolium repens]